MNRSVSLSDLIILVIAGILTVLFSALLIGHHKREDPFSLIHMDNSELHRLWQTDLARSRFPNNQP